MRRPRRYPARTWAAGRRRAAQAVTSPALRTDGFVQRLLARHRSAPARWTPVSRIFHLAPAPATGVPAVAVHLWLSRALRGGRHARPGVREPSRALPRPIILTGRDGDHHPASPRDRSGTVAGGGRVEAVAPLGRRVSLPGAGRLRGQLAGVPEPLAGVTGSARSPSPPPIRTAVAPPVRRTFLRAPAQAPAESRSAAASGRTDQELGGPVPDARGGYRHAQDAGAIDVGRLTEQVIQAIDRRIIAHRERLGRV